MEAVPLMSVAATILFAGAAAAGVLYTLSRRSTGSRTEAAFARRVAELCVAGVYNKLTQESDREAALNAFTAAIENADQSYIEREPCLAPLLRVEMRLIKTGPRRVERTLGLLWADGADRRLGPGDTASALMVADTVMWEDLPTVYRERFVADGGAPQIYLVFSRMDELRKETD